MALLDLLPLVPEVEQFPCCQAGLLASGHVGVKPSHGEPQWFDRADTPVTVAGPLGTCTRFPILPLHVKGHLTAFCFTPIIPRKGRAASAILGPADLVPSPGGPHVGLDRKRYRGKKFVSRSFHVGAHEGRRFRRRDLGHLDQQLIVDDGDNASVQRC